MIALASLFVSLGIVGSSAGRGAKVPAILYLIAAFVDVVAWLSIAYALGGVP